MPFSAGVFSLTYNWNTEAASPPIEIAKLLTQEQDIAAGLSACLLRDGTGLPTAAIPFNSQRITGLGDATAATDALNRQTADARYLPGGSIATDRLLGRDTAGTGVPEALTVSGGLEFTGSGGIQRSALTGDVTAAAGGNATTIANDAVTYAKMQNVSATSRVLGRVTAGAGDVEELTPANLLSFILTVDGAASGLDADLLDGQSGAFYQSAANLNAGTIPDARIQASGVTQHQASLALAASQTTSGTFADARIAQSNVTQHQAALSIATNQLTGALPDARVAQSNVTQHQAALAISASQLDVVVAYGTYTPTLTNTTNVAASVAHVMSYLRVGNVVTVAGEVEVDPTASVSETTLGISLPIASSFTDDDQCSGTGADNSLFGSGAGFWGIFADATNDRATLNNMGVSGTNNRSVRIHFTYRIL